MKVVPKGKKRKRKRDICILDYKPTQFELHNKLLLLLQTVRDFQLRLLIRLCRSFPLMHLHRLLQIHPRKRKDRECSQRQPQQNLISQGNYKTLYREGKKKTAKMRKKTRRYIACEVDRENTGAGGTKILVDAQHVKYIVKTTEKQEGRKYYFMLSGRRKQSARHRQRKQGKIRTHLSIISCFCLEENRHLSIRSLRRRQ